MLQYLILPIINTLFATTILILLFVFYSKQKNRIENFENEVKSKIGSLSHGFNTCKIINNKEVQEEKNI